MGAALSTARRARGFHADPPADDPATASEDVQLDHFVDACSFPSQLLTFEMLRRPIEFTLAAVGDRATARERYATLADFWIGAADDPGYAEAREFIASTNGN